jgi:hypothetical protein
MLSPPIVFLIDENVPDSVVPFLRDRGHTVHLSREVLAAGTKDPVIAKAGDLLTAVVITFNHKHFKSLVARAPMKERQKFRNLGRISLLCSAPRTLTRIEKFIEAIEFHYQQAQKQQDKRLIIELGDSFFRVVA